MKKEIAELLGTFALVFFGCGAIAVAGAKLGLIGIALAFGLALMAASYLFCGHFNPAVSFAHYVAGKMSLQDFLRYAVAQILGGMAGAYALMFLLGHKAGWTVGSGLGETTFGAYGMHGALMFEVIATYVFVKVIFKSENFGAGIGAIAVGLTLAGLHLMGIDISGNSLNPARSFGPAFFVEGMAMDQVWLYFVAPLVGGGLAGLCHKNGYFCCGGGSCSSKK